MIWSKKFFTKIDQENKAVLKKFQKTQTRSTEVLKVGIIGGGPKGIYAIERIASLWGDSKTSRHLEITCFNSDTSFAAGKNYNTNQPDYLLINYSLGNINFWINESIQLVKERFDLVEFINRFKVGTDKIAQPLDFCSRATTGIYLQYCFQKVLKNLPANVSVCLIDQNIIDLDKIGSSYDLITGKTFFSGFSELLFCTGHSYSFSDELTQEYNSLNKENSETVFVPHIYPTQNFQSYNLKSKTVLLQGMGLTFVDAVLALTEGLGGKFESQNNRLTYIPSGKEPRVIYPFSRTGIPMLARKPGLKEKLALKYFNEIFVEQLFESRYKIDFEKDVLPTLILEYRYQFINLFLKIVGYSKQFDKKMLSLDELEQLVGIIFPDFRPFNFWEFIEPKNEFKIQHEFVLDYLKNSIYPGSRPVQQALNAMTSVWRAIHPLFNELYRFGKLKGESQEKFDSYYFGRLSRVSFGPPIANMKKVLALAESNILDFSIAKNPEIITNKKSSRFYEVAFADNQKLQADVLIDARIPKASDIDSLPQVYKKLISRLGVNFYENESYKTACLELQIDGTLKDLPGITLNGTPTEGWTLDNESLSRNNNNFISPWAKRLVDKYVKQTSKIKTFSTLVDRANHFRIH